MYIAITYIGNAYIPGDIIPDDLPAEKLRWLIEAGAVRDTAPAPAINEAKRDEEMTDEESREMTRENYARQVAGMGYDPGDNPIPVTRTDVETPDDEQQDAVEDEIDEEDDAPEIDVMAGIVKDDVKEVEKPAPARKPRTAASNRKAPKGGKAK